MKLIAILSLALLLAACGGSGDNGTVVSPPNGSNNPSEPGPDPTEEVNSIVLSDVIFDFEEQPARVRVWACLEDLSFSCSADRAGTQIWFDPRGEDLTYEVAGEWEHLFVAGVHWSETALYAGAAGVTHPDSLPEGSATWRGNMVGVHRPVTPAGDPQKPSVVRGGAEVTLLDLQAPAVDVVLTPQNLLEIRWEGLAVENGRFSEYRPWIADALGPGPHEGVDSVRGEFYGPNADEVGGVFERDGVIGAFGAGRDGTR